MDARAFRLDWPPGTRLYELDRPEVVDAKDAVASSVGAYPTCERWVIGVDLERPSWLEALLSAKYEAQEPGPSPAAVLPAASAPIREWFYASTPCPVILAAANLFHCSNMLCLAISRGADNKLFSARLGVGICRMLDMNFLEHSPSEVR
jgi:hypothetical protein